MVSVNRVAVIDVQPPGGQSFEDRSQIAGLGRRGNRLYVIPFESGNQTQVSGCLPEDIDGDLCTFNAGRKRPGEGTTDIVRRPNGPTETYASLIRTRMKL